MAATVTSILTNVKAAALAELGSGWQEMPHVLSLEKNDERRGRKAYGARAMSAGNAPTITNSYALDHTFEVVLMDDVPRNGDDTQAQAVIGTLYDKQDEILKRMIRTKLSLPTTVLLVSSIGLSEPEFVGDRQFVALRQQFNVRYRHAI